MSEKIQQSKKLIDKDTAVTYLKLLVGKEAVISCGYGGVIFIEIDALEEQKIEGRKGKLFYGLYSLFCNDNWKFSYGDGQLIERWNSSSDECDAVFDKMGKMRISDIQIAGEFDLTHVVFENGNVFTIIKDDSTDTFQLTLTPEKKRLVINGDGSYEISDYEEDRLWRKNLKAPKKASPTVEISRSFLRDHVPDLLPISKEHSDLFTQSVVGETISSIDISSATTFTIRLGDDYQKKLSKEQQKIWDNPLPQWYISISELWMLKKEGNLILDVAEEKFHFGELLTQSLNGKKLLSFKYDNDGNNGQLTFSDGYTLILQESGRFTRWSVNSHLTGFSVSSYHDGGLRYRISAPIHLTGKYKTEDIHLSAILYEVDFYRKYFASSKESN